MLTTDCLLLNCFASSHSVRNVPPLPFGDGSADEHGDSNAAVDAGAQQSELLQHYEIKQLLSDYRQHLR